jgi:hypothetical protein
MSNEDVTSSELTFFKENEEVLQIIMCITVENSPMKFDCYFSLLSKILLQYQEQSQLLESHLSKLIEPLSDVLVCVARGLNLEVGTS